MVVIWLIDRFGNEPIPAIRVKIGGLTIKIKSTII